MTDTRRLFALGTAQWGMPYGIANATGQPPLVEVMAILAAARRSGLDALDTARAYGESEQVIGQLTNGDPYWKITTKLAPDLVCPGEEMSTARARLGESLATSRHALRRKHLDVVLLHRAQHRFAFDGVLWDDLCARRAVGEIGEIGISAANPTEAWDLVRDPSIDVLQVAASLLDQRLAGAGFFETARACNVRVVVRSVFLQGVAHLAVDALPPHLQALSLPLSRLDDWAKSHSLRRSDAFLLYARDILKASPVLGCESVDQLLDNVVAWRGCDVESGPLEEIARECAGLDSDLLDPARWPDRSQPERDSRALDCAEDSSRAF